MIKEQDRISTKYGDATVKRVHYSKSSGKPYKAEIQTDSGQLMDIYLSDLWRTEILTRKPEKFNELENGDC